MQLRTKAAKEVCRLTVYTATQTKVFAADVSPPTVTRRAETRLQPAAQRKQRRWSPCSPASPRASGSGYTASKYPKLRAR